MSLACEVALKENVLSAHFLQLGPQQLCFLKLFGHQLPFVCKSLLKLAHDLPHVSALVFYPPDLIRQSINSRRFLGEFLSKLLFHNAEVGLL